MDDEYELVHSPLSRTISRDGLTVEIQIYRCKDDDDEWSLEVVDQEGASTVWDETFETDEAALEEAMLTIEKEGIGTFFHDPSRKPH